MTDDKRPPVTIKIRQDHEAGDTGWQKHTCKKQGFTLHEITPEAAAESGLVFLPEEVKKSKPSTYTDDVMLLFTQDMIAMFIAGTTMDGDKPLIPGHAGLESAIVALAQRSARNHGMKEPAYNTLAPLAKRIVNRVRWQVRNEGIE